MESIHQKIELIRASGVDLGLTDQDIDRCLLDVLKEEAARRKSAGRRSWRTASRKRKLCYCLAGVGSVVVALAAILFALVWTDPEYEMWMKAKADPWIYPVTKNWRLMTLGVTRAFDLSALYQSECIVDNPFLKIRNVDCDQCRSVRKEHTMRNVSRRQYEHIYMAKAQPLILKGVHGNVSFNDLRAWYRDNGVTFQPIDNKLQKAPPGVTTIDAFLSGYSEGALLSDDPGFVVEWSSEGVGPSRLLRKLFPRQPFVPDKVEVNLAKTLLVVGPDSGAVRPEMMRRHSPAQWYVQASGSSEIRLSPRGKCDNCRTLSFVVNAGDIVCYNGIVHCLEMLPVTGNTDIIVAFIGAVAMMF